MGEGLKAFQAEAEPKTLQALAEKALQKEGEFMRGEIKYLQDMVAEGNIDGAISRAEKGAEESSAASIYRTAVEILKGLKEKSLGNRS